MVLRAAGGARPPARGGAGRSVSLLSRAARASLDAAGAVAAAVAARARQGLRRLLALLRGVAGEGLRARHLRRAEPVTWRGRHKGRRGGPGEGSEAPKGALAPTAAQGAGRIGKRGVCCSSMSYCRPRDPTLPSGASWQGPESPAHFPRVSGSSHAPRLWRQTQAAGEPGAAFFSMTLASGMQKQVAHFYTPFLGR